MFPLITYAEKLDQAVSAYKKQKSVEAELLYSISPELYNVYAVIIYYITALLKYLTNSRCSK